MKPQVCAAVVACLYALSSSGCDPVYDICVTVIECESREPLVGARVRIPDYDIEMFTEPDGLACSGDAGRLEDPFDVTVDKPGYESTTVIVAPERRAESSSTICIEPLE